MSKNNRWQKPTSREQQDRYLERNGLLNYQTEGMSQADIAQRYANARIKIDTGSTWWQDNYKGNPVGQLPNQQIVQPQPQRSKGGFIGGAAPTQVQQQAAKPSWQEGYQQALMNKLGYIPTSGQDPKWIADAYNQIKAAPNDAALPEYLRTQKDQISEAYNWFSFRNGNKPFTEWSYLDAADPAHDFLKTIQPAPQATTPAGYGGATLDQVKSGAANWTDITVADRRAALSDPKFYSQNKILSYPQAIQQQMYSDPAFDWDKLPKLQKIWFELSSRPAVMGAINAGGIGLVTGYALGGPVGALVGGGTAAASGAALGKLAEWGGYDQNKEAWDQGDKKFNMPTLQIVDGKFKLDIQQAKDTINFAMGALNYLAEKGEQIIGTAAQVAHAAIDPKDQVKDVLNKDTFNSSMAFYETITPSIVGNVIGAAVGEDGKLTMKDALNFLPWVYSQNVITGLIAEPEKYKGQEIYIGAALPVQLQQDWTERLAIAREQVAAGRNYREVTTEMQTGIMAQVGDLIGQTIFDPLNLLAPAQTQVGKIGSAISGNKIAAEAFRGTVGFEQAKVKYSNIVTTLTEAVKIDPTFDVSKLSWVEKQFAGLNNQREIKAGSVGFTQKGLLDPISKAEANPNILKDPINFWKNVVNETPISRAQTGLTMFDRNIGNIISMFKDPTEAAGYLERIARGDNTAWAEMGSQIGNSPEWYTILPALKEYTGEKLTGLAKAYELTKDNRSALNRMAEVLRQDPTKLIDEWASRNTRDQDFTRVIQAAKEDGSPAAKALLEDYKSGHFTPDTLSQIVEAFHGEGALPYTDAQWKWAMYADLSDHFSGWVADHLLLDQSPEAQSAFFRTVGVLKQAQSILLLGASPGYAIQNGLSGIVHLAVTGIYGNQTPGQMRDWITRWETPIPRLDEGVGIGGLVDTAKSTAISDAVKGTGPLTDIKRMLGKLSRGMPMSKLSSKFESINSKRGYVTAIQQFMGKSWRRGVGFSKMDPALIKVLQDAGINPDHIYSAFEAGVNQKDIENALIAPYAGQKVEAMINDAATAAGLKPADAAEMLNIIGVTDTLNTFLKGADTLDKVDVAFARANRKMQDWIDIKAGEDLKFRAEEVKNIVSREGMAAGLKISQQASDQFFAAWFDHYDRFGDVMGGLEGLDPAMRSKAIEEAYRQSDVNFRRVFAQMGANYKGIFDAWALSGDPSALGSLRAISDMNNSMRKAYDFMRQANRDLTATLIRENRAPTWKELGAKNKSVNAVFKQAFIEKHQAEVAMGDNLRGVYTKLHGEKAGNAAKLWWHDVTDFSEKIVADEARFRAEIDQARAMGASQADIADAKKKYYSQDKQRFIDDLQKINDKGIARLERMIKDGGQQTPTPTPTPPTQPTPGTEAPTAEAKPAKPTKEKKLTIAQKKAAQMEADTIALLATNKIDAEEASARKAQQDIVWAIAKDYNYDNLKIGGDYDAHALTRSLRNETYGGYPGAELYDVRFTREKVIEILEKRKTLKQTEADKNTPPSIQALKKTRRGNQADRTILLDVISHGGLNKERMGDVGGDPGKKYTNGLFMKRTFDTGWDISDMARRLAEDHYAIDLNDPNDLGGVNQATALIQKALAGERVYPVNHDYTQNEAKIAADELAHIEALKADEAAFAVEKFNQDTWHAAMKDAIANKDGDAVETLFGDLPDNLADTPHDMDGETYAEYVLRVQNAIDADAVNDAQASAIAQAKTQTDQHMADAETRAEAATTRTMILEQITEIWGGDQAQRWIEIEDAKIRGLAKVMGEDFDSVYARYYAEFRKSLEMDPIEALKEEWLKQYSPIEGGAERAKTPEDIQNFARMLARKSESDVGAAIREEALLSDRVAILDALYNMNPTLAENVARNEWSALMQQVWHGSPYKFDKFSLDHMGSGEGAQAYGWGLYFAGDKKVADWYRGKLSDRTTMTVTRKDGSIAYSGDQRRAPDGYTQAIKYIGMWNKKAELYYRNNYGIAEDYFTTHKSEVEAKERALESERQSYPSVITDRTPEQKQRIMDIDDAAYKVGQELVRIERHQNTIDAIKELQESKLEFHDADQGQLYAVDIPDDNYLLWDRVLSDQPESVREALRANGIEKPEWIPTTYQGEEAYRTFMPDGYDFLVTFTKNDDPIRNQWAILAKGRLDFVKSKGEAFAIAEMWYRNTLKAGDAYDLLAKKTGSPKSASVALKEAGISGIQYLDGSSRGKGEGNYNYVIFDDNAVKILETYYQNQAKGAVTFDAEGIKATIHAFEAADVTTLIHESGHVFLKMMNDAAERTGNAQLKRDLLTIADHTRADEVSPGKWKAANAIDTITEVNGKYIYQGVGGPQEFPTLERARFVLEHEVFARTYENYVATGLAPTPHLKAAFDSFRKWMLEVYKTIKGSDIDIKIASQVEDVFDRMLAAEPNAEGGTQKAGYGAGEVYTKKLNSEILGLDEIKYKITNDVPVPVGTRIIETRMYTQKYELYRVSIVENAEGARYSFIENKKEIAGSPAEIIVRFDKMRTEDIERNSGLSKFSAKFFEEVNKKTETSKIQSALFQRNKAQVSAAQFDMFAPRPEAQPTAQADMFTPGVNETDAGTTGGMLPGMQDATGMMFDVQEGGGIRKMDTGSARSIYDIDPTKTAGEYKPGDIVQDADGKQHTVAGANMRSKIITEKGRILEPKDVTRVAKQGDLFSLPPEPKPIEAPAVTVTPEKLADFGEKLGGARKDKSQFVERNIADADIASLSLSEIWPKAEVDKIEDVSMAALATTMRELIPSKPRDSWKLKRWVEAVKTIRELMKYADEKGVDATTTRIKELTSTLRTLQGVPDKMTVLTQIPREKWSRIGKVENRPNSFAYKDGQSIPKPYAMAEMDGRLIDAANLEELAALLNEKLKVEVSKSSAMKFEIRGNSKQVFINKVGDPLYRKLITFDTEKEARAYIRENADALVQAWEGVKESDNVKETDVRRAENRPRAGKDYRQGKDATPEMFNTFGFRGVEFGNWVSQGGNLKERQGMLNAAYDGLMDLADIVHIPPKALSLNGTLGLGLGSRGSGWASAHFEPDAIVINLTKTRGAGSLAHEWFHAMDNYFQRKREGAVKEKMITYQPENYYISPNGDHISETRFNQFSERQREYIKADQWKLVEGVRPEVSEMFTKLVEQLDASPMNKRTKLIDKGKSGGYWSSVIERAARSFEGYVISKMQQDGYQNDYLANVQKIEDFPRDPSRYPYLLDEELAPVVEAFDNLFNTVKVDDTGMLYQSANPADPFKNADLPLGTFPEEAPHAQAMAEGMNDHILPLMKALQDVARKNLDNKPLNGAMKDLSPEGRAMLNKYTRQVQADLAGTKNAATKWGESRRDFAMLNYNKRYGFDRYLEAVYPYQFFYTRSLATWAARALDKPAMFATYARIKKQQNRYERDIPERLRGKIKINMPWLPDWMGDALYIDPLKTLFTPLNYLRPLERMMQDASYQQIEAERILQEWAADGSVNESEIVNAIKTRDGATWERAYAEAQIRRESEINNPVDFMNSMLGPAWYLTTPWKLLKGEQAGIGSTPILNTTRAIETVAKGTWAQPMGDLIGMIGKPEEMLRKKLGIPEFGEYGDYYVDRQLANMVADGKTTSQLATQAMIERTGPLFDEARQRVKMELAMRVPTASMFMAGLTGANFAQGVAQMAMASPASLFGAGLLPAGELEYRGLKQEWNEAWKMKDAGDPKAITAFFDAHPEYESFLAKGKPPEERLKSFLIGQIWDGYMGLGKTDQKTVGAAMGDTFRQSFLDKETRSYDALDVTTLTHWAQMLSMMTPKTEATLPAIEQPAAPINFYPEEVSAITDKFFTDRTAKFPNYYVMEQGFYSLAKSDRARYLIQFPKLRQYWDWKDTYMKTYPELAPIMKGQVFKTLDTSAWPPMLEDAVMNYAYSGSKMGKGTYAALQQVWIQEGQPLGDMMSWVNSTVVPAMLYQAQPQP